EAAHAQFASGLEATVFGELNRVAVRVAREEGALVVDLTPTFLQVAPHTDLYIDEVHANARGATLIAGALADAIARHVRSERAFRETTRPRVGWSHSSGGALIYLS